MIASLISAHGLSTGLFTSPHLDRVEQRFELSGHPIAAAEFAEAMEMLAPIVDMYEERSGDGITYFELTAALAFSWFAERTVVVGVLETGLGGRWDATNAATSEVAVVTNIALEHTEYSATPSPRSPAKLANRYGCRPRHRGYAPRRPRCCGRTPTNRALAGSDSDRSTARSTRRPPITDGCSTSWASTMIHGIDLRSLAPPGNQLGSRWPRSVSLQSSSMSRRSRPQRWWSHPGGSRFWEGNPGC